jgi:hypothetical protein
MVIIVSLHDENSRSEDAEVAGMAKKSLAIRDR